MHSIINTFTDEQRNDIQDMLKTLQNGPLTSQTKEEVYKQIIEIEAAMILYHAMRLGYQRVSMHYEDRPQSEKAVKRELLSCYFGGDHNAKLCVLDFTDCSPEGKRLQTDLLVIEYNSNLGFLLFGNQPLQSAIMTFAQHLFTYSQGFREIEPEANSLGDITIEEGGVKPVVIDVCHTCEIIDYENLNFFA